MLLLPPILPPKNRTLELGFMVKKMEVLSSRLGAMELASPEIELYQLLSLPWLQIGLDTRPQK